MKIKLVVGLGNPGKEYENTRHNMGFMVIDKIAQKLNIRDWKQRDGALYFDCFYNMNRVIFLKPQKYINLSGDVIIKFVNYFEISLDDILIISDDLDMEIGSIKLKEKGSSGGHNGLKNIELRLKTNEYKRIKLGISNNKTIDTKDYVLGKFSKEDKKIVEVVIEEAACAALDFTNNSFTDLMNTYNKKNRNR